MTNKRKTFGRYAKLIAAAFIIASTLFTVYPALGAYPSSLDLTVLSTNMVRLDWVDTLTNEAGYKIDRKTDTGDFSEIATLSANSTSYSDYTVTAGHIYTYRVRSFISGNLSSIHTDEVSTTTNMIAAPISLTVTPYSTSRLDLNWSYPESKTYDTAIERRVDGGLWEPLATVEKGTSSYSDTNLTQNTKYYYRVKAVAAPHVFSITYPNDNTGVSAYTRFDGPSEFYGFASAPNQIYVVWNDIPYEAGYVVEKKNGVTGTFETAVSVPANTTFWLDTKVSPNARYVYRVKAVNGTNVSSYTDEVVIASVFLAEPSKLTAVATSAGVIRLDWKDNSNSETGFEIWRKEGSSGKWELHDRVGRDTNSFEDTGLSPDKQYFYRVRAIISHSYIYSAFTLPADAWTVMLKAPGTPEVSAVSDKEISFTWEDNSNNESGFTVERKTGDDGEWIEIASLPANSTSFTDVNVKPDVRYYYRVKAFDDTYYNSASYSDEIAVNVGVPDAPSDLKLTPASSSQIKLVWKDNSDDELGFAIERKVFNGVKYTEVARVDANKTSYTDGGLYSSTRYYYRVKAFNKTGGSQYSNEIYTATKSKVTFKDVQTEGREKQIIENLCSRGVFKSKPGGLFGPNDRMTRGELMYALVKALEIDMTPAGSFTDVKKGSTYYREIMIADKAGIITRDGNNYFYPNRQLTREELAVFITRALKAVDRPLSSYDTSILDEFDDRASVPEDSVYYITSVFGEGIMEGKASGNQMLIAPKSYVTRLEAAVTIYNMLEWLSE